MSTPTPPPAATVVRDITVTATNPAGQTADLTTRWTYNPADPYAIAVDFAPGEPDPDPWLLSRGLLQSAYFQPGHQLGEGNVWAVVFSHRLFLSLASPDDHFMCAVSASEVHAFLGQTYRIVPPGTESRFLDVDALVARLLGEVSS